MKLYLNELAPWERKNEYLHHIQLGKDVQSQTEILKNAINNQTKAQLTVANSIIASQERISEGIQNLERNVVNSMEGLKASFEWGISEVVWQLEKTREELKNILDTIQSPLETEAIERKRRGEEAFANGWIDDAEIEFLESEKLNKFDFSIHISLGLIYLFHRIDKNKAYTYFNNAIKYAEPKSKYYTSFSLLFKALICRDFDDIEKAERCTEKAIELYPSLTEAYYQSAQYNAQLKNVEKSIQRLKFAIESDLNYLLKVSNDPMFDNIREDIINFIKTLRNKQEFEARKKINKLKRNFLSLLSKANEINERYKLTHNWKIEETSISQQIGRMETILSRRSYFDAVYVNENVSSIHVLLLKLTCQVITSFKEFRSCLENKYKETENRKSENLFKRLLCSQTVENNTVTNESELYLI